MTLQEKMAFEDILMRALTVDRQWFRHVHDFGHDELAWEINRDALQIAKQVQLDFGKLLDARGPTPDHEQSVDMY